MAKPGKKKVQKPVESSAPEFDNAGEYFHKLRTEKGLSTREVSEITRISVINLDAIENQNFEALPADTFTRGFLTIYSDFLGADTPYIVARFMEERESSRNPGKKARMKQPKKVLAPKTLAEPSHVSSMTMAGTLLLVIVVLFTGFCLYTSWNPFSFLFKKSENIQSVMQNVFSDSNVTEEEPVVTEPIVSFKEEDFTGEAETNTALEPPSDLKQDDTTLNEEEKSSEETATIKYIAHITFLKDTRLKVILDGQAVSEEIFFKGDEKDLAAYHSLQLAFDEPGSATILVNGEPVAFPEITDGSATLHIPVKPGI